MLKSKGEQSALLSDLKRQVEEGEAAIRSMQSDHVRELEILHGHIKELDECREELESHLQDAEDRIKELGRVGQIKCERIEQKLTKQLETERRSNKELIEKIEKESQEMLEGQLGEVEKDTREMLERKIGEVAQLTKQLEGEKRVNKERMEQLEKDTREMLERKIGEVAQPSPLDPGPYAKDPARRE